MKYIKKFETFDFNQTLHISSIDNLINYYSCDNCNALWKSKEIFDNCKFCTSDEIENLDENEYYNLVNGRLEDDEVEDLNNEREYDSNTFVDLYSLKNNNGNVN